MLLIKFNSYYTNSKIITGSEKLLKQLSSSIFTLESEDISTTHNTIGVAMGGYSSVYVGQFDLDGNLKLNVTFKFKFYVKSVALLNIDEGGFILLVGGINVDSDIYNEHLKMLKISADNKIIGSVKNMEANPCANQMTLQLFQNEAEEYCVAILCTKVRRRNFENTFGKQFAELLVKCYTDDAFTVDDTPSP